jgi:hypothetical protein
MEKLSLIRGRTVHWLVSCNQKKKLIKKTEKSRLIFYISRYQWIMQWKIDSKLCIRQYWAVEEGTISLVRGPAQWWHRKLLWGFDFDSDIDNLYINAPNLKGLAFNLPQISTQQLNIHNQSRTIHHINRKFQSPRKTSSSFRTKKIWISKTT